MDVYIVAALKLVVPGPKPALALLLTLTDEDNAGERIRIAFVVSYGDP